MEIREVRSRADLNDFIRLPWRIYKNDPHWVPPLIVEVKEFLNRRKHPFYLHGDAAQFLALRDGQAAGPNTRQRRSSLQRKHGSNLGCFGMFECANDRQAAHALLDAAAGWLRARGRSEIRGPIDYSTNYPCGLLIDGFDTPPRVMMNHNPMYYAALLESWGLTKAKDLYAWWFVNNCELSKRWRHRVERIIKRTGITIRHFDNNNFDAEVVRCREVYNSAMHDLWGFVKLTDAEFRHLAQRLRKIAQKNRSCWLNSTANRWAFP